MSRLRYNNSIGVLGGSLKSGLGLQFVVEEILHTNAGNGTV